MLAPTNFDVVMPFGLAERRPGAWLAARLLTGTALPLLAARLIVPALGLWLLAGTQSALAQSVTGTGDINPGVPAPPLPIWSVGGALNVGNAGTGTLTITDGGTVTSAGAGGPAGSIGVMGGSSGTVTVTGAGSTWTTIGSLVEGDLHVGAAGTGTLTVENRGMVRSTSGYIGDASGSSGTATVTGAGSLWQFAGVVDVGRDGTGTLTIADGGTVQGTTWSSIGKNGSGSGTVTVTGAGSAWYGTIIEIGNVGTLSVEKGGHVRTAAILLSGTTGGTLNLLGDAIDGRGVLEINYLIGNYGTVNLNGGILRARMNHASFFDSVGGQTIGANGAFFDSNGYDIVVSASFDGSGGLTKQGAGTLVLSGSNSYTGDTLVQAGRLVGDTASSFSSDSNVTVSAGATLAVSGGIVAAAGSLSGAGSVEIASGATLITGTTDQSKTFSGSFSGDGGLGFTGAGMQIYTGTGTLGGGFATCVCATGQFVVRGGSLTLGDDVKVQGGTLLVDQGGQLDNGGGTLLVASKVTVDGAGSAISTGITLVQSFAGTTSLTISGGASLTGSGGASLIGFGGSAEALVSGNGSRWIVGGGGLSIAPGATTASSVTVAEGGELRIASGDLQIAALGRLNIGNGGRAGRIDVASGAIVNDGAIVANFTDSYSYSDTIVGSGSLTKTGPGTLTLSGTNSYDGATLVNGGKLVVNGTIASSSGVTVAAGAAIGGSGIVPSLTVNGTLAPGNSPGTMTVSGNLTLAAGSAYEAEVQGAVSDRVNVSGTAALAGTLKIIPLGGAYAFNSPYTLLSATGGRNGTFSPVDATGPFGDGVTTTVSYTATDVRLTLAPKPLTPIVATPHLGVAAPANAYAVAAAIDGAVAAGGDPSALFGIYNLSAVAIPAAVNQLSGEIHSAAPALANLASDQFLRAMLDPMAAGRLPPGAPGPGTAAFAGLARRQGDRTPAPTRLDTPAYSIWGTAFGSHGRSDGDAAAGSARRGLDDAHLATGIDIRLMPGTVAGLAVAGGKARASLPGLLGKIDAEVFQAGLYGVSQLGPVKLGAAASYARLDNDVSRGIPALGASLSSSYETMAWSGRLQASVAAFSWNRLSFSPLAALQATRARDPALTETNWAGASAGALRLAKRSAVSSRGELGLQLDADGVFGGMPITGYVRAAWAHSFQRDADLTASLVGLPAAAFTATGAKADRDSALLAVGVSARLGERVTLGLNLDGELAANSNRIGASAQFRVRF